MQSLGQMMRVLTLTQGILLFILLGLSRAEVVAPSNEDGSRKTVYEMDIDNLIDENMETIRELALEMDPLKLDDVNFPLQNSIYMFLHTGWAQNLAQLYRTGKCKIRYTEKKLNVDLILGWKDFVFDYRYLMKFIFFTRVGDLHGEMAKLNIHIGLNIDFRNYHVTLQKLDIEKKSKVKISIEGHWLDHIYNVAIKVITRIFHQRILKTICDKTKDMIVHRIDEVNFKLGSIINARQFTFIDLTDTDNLPIMYNSNIDDNNIN